MHRVLEVIWLYVEFEFIVSPIESKVQCVNIVWHRYVLMATCGKKNCTQCKNLSVPNNFK